MIKFLANLIENLWLLIPLNKRHKICFAVPFLTIIAAYFGIHYILTLKIFGEPIVEPWAVLDYHLSRLLIFCDLSEFVKFDVPADILAYFWNYEIEGYADYVNTKITPKEMIRVIDAIENILPQLHHFYSNALTILSADFAISLMFYLYFHGTQTVKNSDRVIRGTQRVSAKELAKISGQKPQIIAQIPLAAGGSLSLTRSAIVRHLIVMGSSGSGKSQLLLQLLPQLLKQNYGNLKAVIVDVKGEFIGHFYRPERDFIFNPFDTRSVGWNLFSELSINLNHHIQTETEPPVVRLIANGLADIASHGQDKNKFFYTQSANVFFSAIMFCYINNLRTMRDFVRFCRRPADEILKDFKKMPTAFGALGIGALNSGNETQANIMTTMHEQLNKFSSILEVDGNFSIRDFFRQPGNLYLSRAGSQSENFEAVFSLLVNLFALQIKGTPEPAPHEKNALRYLVFIDEFSDLPAMASISKYLLPRSRSQGCAVILGTQSIARIRQLYSPDGATDLMNDISTRFYFKSKASSEAEAIAKDLGSAEVERASVGDNVSHGSVLSGGNHSSDTENRSVAQNQAFTAAELQNLQIGECVADLQELTINGIHVIAKIKPCEFTGEKRQPFFIDKYAEIEEAAEFEEQQREKSIEQAEMPTVIEEKIEVKTQNDESENVKYF